MLTAPLLPPDPTRKPAQMTPDERLQEIAFILAKGTLRVLKSQADVKATTTQKESSNQASIRLAITPERSLHVSAWPGSPQPRPAQPGEHKDE